MAPPALLGTRSFATACGVYLLAYLAFSGFIPEVEGWSLGEGGIKAYIEENEAFDVNNDWPETVSAAGNVISDATLALLRATS